MAWQPPPELPKQHAARVEKGNRYLLDRTVRRMSEDKKPEVQDGVAQEGAAEQPARHGSKMVVRKWTR